MAKGMQYPFFYPFQLSLSYINGMSQNVVKFDNGSHQTCCTFYNGDATHQPHPLICVLFEKLNNFSPITSRTIHLENRSSLIQPLKPIWDWILSHLLFNKQKRNERISMLKLRERKCLMV